MHGLINRSLQCYVRDTYGPQTWAMVRESAGLGFADFEAMLSYDDALTEAVIAAATLQLGKQRAAFLEDMGTYLVSHPNLEPLRRLLRFGGDTFVEFLHSLDDLHDRAKLAVPELEMPQLELVEFAPQAYRLLCRWKYDGFGLVFMGVLRAMADDYGALVVLNHVPSTTDRDRVESILIEVMAVDFSEGRQFMLGAMSA